MRASVLGSNASINSYPGRLHFIMSHVFRRKLHYRKRLMVVTTEQLDEELFDVHKIDSVTVDGYDLEYLTKYGIEQSLAFEIHKIISKHPRLLPFFEELLAKQDYVGSKVGDIYKLIEHINKELAQSR